MKLNSHTIFIILFLLVSNRISLCAQKKNVDTSSFNGWPKVTLPKISPNGKYVMYYEENNPIGQYTIVIKSLVSNWVFRDTCSTFNYSGRIDDNNAFYFKNNKNLGIVRLGGSGMHTKSVKSFKSYNLKSFNSFATLTDSGILSVTYLDKKEYYSNVEDYYFALDGNSILLNTKDPGHVTKSTKLQIVDLKKNNIKDLWSGNSCERLTLNKSKDIFAFITSSSDDIQTKFVISYNLRNGKCDTMYFNGNKRLKLSNIHGFTKRNESIIVSLSENPLPKDGHDNLNLTIWNHNDSKIENEKEENRSPNFYFATASIEKKNISQIQLPRDNWHFNLDPDNINDKVVISQTIGDCIFRESGWNPACQKRWILVDLISGERQVLYKLDGLSPYIQCIISPSNEYVIYWDDEKESYFTYHIPENKITNISNSIFKRKQLESNGTIKPANRGIAGWLKDEKKILVYDDQDVWLLSTNGTEKAKNVTNGFGSKNNIVFSLLNQGNNITYGDGENILLTAFSIDNKKNGFYETTLNSKKDPKILTMGSYIYYLPFGAVWGNNGMKPIKAERANAYIVRRESFNESPNYFYTDNFKTFKEVSCVYPERKYNWVKSELTSIKLPDGKVVKGILYKPSNFDSTKRYPLLINVYERFSNLLNAYMPPDPLCLGCDANPLVFANSGYIVFRPDIYYKLDNAGECALATVNASIEFLQGYKWIDTSRMGIVGCSYGGYETNYIITRSDKFKAACASSSLTDLISYSNDHSEVVYTALTLNQFRVNKMIWEDPKPILENSPITRVNNIKTPLLLFHTTNDGALNIKQAVQFFFILRTLGKKVWLLQYGDADHGLTDPNQKLDFSTRMMQFFNFYLKGSEEPGWMGTPPQKVKRSEAIQEGQVTTKVDI